MRVFAVLNLRGEHLNASFESAAATLRIVVSNFGYYSTLYLTSAFSAGLSSIATRGRFTRKRPLTRGVGF